MTRSVALEEAKNVARTFSTYFKNNKLKNENREVATNVTTAYKYVDLARNMYIIFVIVENSCLFSIFLCKK